MMLEKIKESEVTPKGLDSFTSMKQDETLFEDSVVQMSWPATATSEVA